MAWRPISALASWVKTLTWYHKYTSYSDVVLDSSCDKAATRTRVSICFHPGSCGYSGMRQRYTRMFLSSSVHVPENTEIGYMYVPCTFSAGVHALYTEKSLVFHRVQGCTSFLIKGVLEKTCRFEAQTAASPRRIPVPHCVSMASQPNT